MVAGGWAMSAPLRLRVQPEQIRWRCYYTDCRNRERNPTQHLLVECDDDPVTCPRCREALGLPLIEAYCVTKRNRVQG